MAIRSLTALPPRGCGTSADPRRARGSRHHPCRVESRRCGQRTWRKTARTSSTNSRGLLERGEVPAALGLVPVPDVREAPLGPAARRPLQLLREHRAAGRHVDRRARRAADQLAHLPDALPVQPRGRRAGAGQPVEHQVVEQPVARDHRLQVAVVVGPGPELLGDPGAQRGRRVDQPVADRLRSRRVLDRVARVPLVGVAQCGERRALRLGEVVERGRVRRRERRDQVDRARRARGPAARGSRRCSCPSRRPARRSARSRAAPSAPPTRGRCARRPSPARTACR